MLASGYFPITAAYTRGATKWHLFRGVVSLCGMHEVTALAPDSLEAEMQPDSGRHYCKSCQKILALEVRNNWPPEAALSRVDKEFIRAHWATHTATSIAHLLGRTLYDRVKQWGCSYCPKKDSTAGRFSKGDIPRNAKPGVEETLRTDKRGVQYWHVRGGKYGWTAKHVVLWEAAYGPVPTGKVVVFKDKNTLHCVLENLELLTRDSHLGRNSGRDELTDQYVSSQLARISGKRGQFIDREIQQELLQVPEILEVKRNQMRLNRVVKAASNP